MVVCSVRAVSDSTEVVFVIEGVEVPVHRAILSARSPIFKAMFQSTMQDATAKLVPLSDVKLSTFCLLLAYLYCGDLFIDSRMSGGDRRMEHELLAHRVTAIAGGSVSTRPTPPSAAATTTPTGGKDSKDLKADSKDSRTSGALAVDSKSGATTAGAATGSGASVPALNAVNAAAAMIDQAFDVVDLLVAANRFQLDGLSQVLEARLGRRVSESNVCHLLVFASYFELETLLSVCTMFVLARYDAITVYVTPGSAVAVLLGANR